LMLLMIYCFHEEIHKLCKVSPIKMQLAAEEALVWCLYVIPYFGITCFTLGSISFF
jgi:hypothetical protein